MNCIYCGVNRRGSARVCIRCKNDRVARDADYCIEHSDGIETPSNAKVHAAATTMDFVQQAKRRNVALGMDPL